MRLEPTAFPLTITMLPLACFGKMSWEMPVIAAGYSNPVSTVKTTVKRNPGPSSLIIFTSVSCQPQRDDELVDQPNARKRCDDSAKPIDQKIPAQHLAGAYRFVLNASQRQRHQRDDDHCIKDH